MRFILVAAVLCSMALNYATANAKEFVVDYGDGYLVTSKGQVFFEAYDQSYALSFDGEKSSSISSGVDMESGVRAYPLGAEAGLTLLSGVVGDDGDVGLMANCSAQARRVLIAAAAVATCRAVPSTCGLALIEHSMALNALAHCLNHYQQER